MIATLSSNETFRFLEQNNCIYISHRQMTEAEAKRNIFNDVRKFSLKKIVSTKKEYQLTAFSLSEKKYKSFWVEVTIWFYFPFILEILLNRKISGNKEVEYLEETNFEFLKNLNEELRFWPVIIKGECPSCKYKVESNDLVCENCGLSLL